MGFCWFISRIPHKLVIFLQADSYSAIPLFFYILNLVLACQRQKLLPNWLRDGDAVAVKLYCDTESAPNLLGHKSFTTPTEQSQLLWSNIPVIMKKFSLIGCDMVMPCEKQYCDQKTLSKMPTDFFVINQLLIPQCRSCMFCPFLFRCSARHNTQTYIHRKFPYSFLPPRCLQEEFFYFNWAQTIPAPIQQTLKVWSNFVLWITC